jgi:hypothetical protein
MSALDFEIQEFCRGDEKMRTRIIEDITAFDNGTKRYFEMCSEAQIVHERWETGQTEEINGSFNTMRAMNTSQDERYIDMSTEEEDYGTSERSLLK